MEATAQECTNPLLQDQDAPDGTPSQPLVPHLIPRSRTSRLHSRLPKRLRAWWLRFRSWVWDLVESLLEEFQPWLKWIIFDAVLTLLLGTLVNKLGFEVLRAPLEALGLL